MELQIEMIVKQLSTMNTESQATWLCILNVVDIIALLSTSEISDNTYHQQNQLLSGTVRCKYFP